MLAWSKAVFPVELIRTVDFRPIHQPAFPGIISEVDDCLQKALTAVA